MISSFYVMGAYETKSKTQGMSIRKETLHYSGDSMQFLRTFLLIAIRSSSEKKVRAAVLLRN